MRWRAALFSLARRPQPKIVLVGETDALLLRARRTSDHEASALLMALRDGLEESRGVVVVVVVEPTLARMKRGDKFVRWRDEGRPSADAPTGTQRRKQGKLLRPLMLSDFLSTEQLRRRQRSPP